MKFARTYSHIETYKHLYIKHFQLLKTAKKLSDRGRWYLRREAFRLCERLAKRCETRDALAYWLKCRKCGFVESSSFLVGSVCLIAKGLYARERLRWQHLRGKGRL